MTVNIYDENNNVAQSVAITAEDFDSEIPTFEVMVLDDHIDFGQYIAGYSLRSAGNTETLVATYAYDANGNRTRLTYANGTTTTYAYNQANLVTSVVNKKGNTTLSSHSYTYYLDGNIASENENGTSRTYEYDGLGRLTKETRNGTITVYTYDLNGNRATMTQNGVTTTYEYDANNRLLKETVASAITTYTYDANGNLINAWNSGNPVGAYSYNLFGNQVSFTADSIVYTNYTYRPDGLRHNIGDKVHVWDGANIVADVDGGNDIVVYIRGINLIYADDGDKTYYHFNAHGDVVALTNANGSKTKSYAYNAFGVEYNESTLDDNPFRYCGEYYDKETKTIYLRARYYNPAQGRFTQQDGWEFASCEEPLSLNLYTYCWNNPIKYDDSNGHYAKSADYYTLKENGLGGAGGGGALLVVTEYLAQLVEKADQGLAKIGNALAGAWDGFVNFCATQIDNIAYLLAEGSGLEAEVKAEIESEEKVEVQERSYYVYVLLNEDTSQVEYVGRTLDPIKRAQAHANDPNRSHLEMRIIHKNLTLEEARGLEQVEMLYYHTYKAIYAPGKNSCNKINGISPKNRNREIYMRAATAYFENIVSNEFYCLEELFEK